LLCEVFSFAHFEPKTLSVSVSELSVTLGLVWFGLVWFGLKRR